MLGLVALPGPLVDAYEVLDLIHECAHIGVDQPEKEDVTVGCGCRFDDLREER